MRKRSFGLALVPLLLVAVFTGSGAAASVAPAQANGIQAVEASNILLVNSNSGYCLDQHYRTWPTGATNTVLAWSQCHGSANQRWDIIKYNGVNKIVNRASGMCLDQHFEVWPTVPTTQMYVWQCHTYANQEWIITNITALHLLIKNRQSRDCLDQHHLDGLRGPTTTVVAWDNCHGMANQVWRVGF